MTHATLSSLDAAARAATLEDSRACLEEITGAACAAFRAPYFDLPKGLGPVIEEAGYRWSSSKAPFSPVARYRHLLACRRPHLLAGSEVHEVPVPGFLGLPIPEGLSYRRLFWPLSALPARPPRVFYLHPWELLESVDSHDLPRWARALTRWRSGRWAARHLWAWLDAWIARGAVIEPPELPSGAATAAGPPPPPR